jgi:alkylation response protein AidB-like acyl-CoA dehydrogenase
MDFDLGDEHELVRRTAREFADAELVERARENDRTGRFDLELVAKLADQGYLDDHPVERHFRDVRVTTLYEGTSQIQKLAIGRALTGVNAIA